MNLLLKLKNKAKKVDDSTNINNVANDVTGEDWLTISSTDYDKRERELYIRQEIASLKRANLELLKQRDRLDKRLNQQLIISLLCVLTTCILSVPMMFFVKSSLISMILTLVAGVAIIADTICLCKNFISKERHISPFYDKNEQKIHELNRELENLAIDRMLKEIQELKTPNITNNESNHRINSHIERDDIDINQNNQTNTNPEQNEDNI